jgi:hypothetical protein
MEEAGGMSSTRQLLEQHTLTDLFTRVHVTIDDDLKASAQHARFFQNLRKPVTPKS